ncbi:MAG: flagellar basal body-associated FliL family protein, partial [Oxalobacteraceae bacterium]
PTDLVRQAQPVYYEIDPPLTVNLKDTDAILQVGISLSTHFASVNDALKNDDPALRSAILFALADVQADTATNDASKEQLLTTIVSAVNRQLQHDGYNGSIDGAYFTSFIIQNQDGGDV